MVMLIRGDQRINPLRIRLRPKKTSPTRSIAITIDNDDIWIQIIEPAPCPLNSSPFGTSISWSLKHYFKRIINFILPYLPFSSAIILGDIDNLQTFLFFLNISENSSTLIISEKIG